MTQSAWDLVRHVLEDGPAPAGLLRDRTGLAPNRIARALRFHMEKGRVGIVPDVFVFTDRGNGAGRRGRVYYLSRTGKGFGKPKGGKMTERGFISGEAETKIRASVFRFTDAGRPVTASDVSTHSGCGEWECATILRRLVLDGVLTSERVKRVTIYMRPDCHSS